MVFGGGGTIEIAEGELTLGVLIAGPDGASLEATLAVAEAVARSHAPRRWVPELRDVTVTDDQGGTSAVRFGSGIAGYSPESKLQLWFEAGLRLTRSEGQGAGAGWT